MFGFAIGALCLALFFHGARRGRHRHHHHRGRGPGGFSGAFRWLRVRPEQREPLEEALEDLERDATGIRTALMEDRETLAAALEGETLDPAALEDLWIRASVELASRKEALIASVRRIHETLDPAQRAKLARMVGRRSPRHGGHLGAYRSWA